MDLVGNRLDQRRKEVDRGLDVGGRVQLGKGKLRRPIDRHEEVELALLGANLGDVDVEVADRVALEGLFGGLVTGDLRQTADAVALEAAMQGRPGQVRDGRLQGIEAVVERQQRMLAEGDDDRLFLGRQDCRARRFRPHRGIVDEGPLAPLGNCLVVQPILCR